jgi:hypothetical protein
MPSGEPTAYPTNSPTSACRGGLFDYVEGICVDCPENEFSDGVLCITCPAGRTNRGTGNKECDLYYSTIPLWLPSTAVAIFGLCSLAAYVGYVKHGGHKGAISTVAIVSADQLSDILFATVGYFHSRYLMIACQLFVVIPLIPLALYILYKTKWESVIPLRLSMAVLNAVAVMGVHEHIDEGASRWVFHNLSFHGIVAANTLIRGVLLLLGDFMWPIVLVAPLLLAGLVCQALLLVFGIVMLATKLMGGNDIGKLFWQLWHADTSDYHAMAANADANNHGAVPYLVNMIVPVEVVVENIPQLII